MPSRRYIMGLFKDETRTVSVLNDIKRTRFTVEDVRGPVPSSDVLKALGRPKSKVGYFTLAGGIMGFLCGMGLAIYTAVQWHLVVSGKPVVALIPFFVVGFEFTVLFAVLGNILGMITQARLPRFTDLSHHDPRCTGNCFGILVSCVQDRESELVSFFRERGGEVTHF